MPKTKQIKKLSDLTPDTKNANKGTQRGGGLLESSLQNYGAGRSVLVDRNGNLIAGNKTTEAAVSIGLDDDVILVPSDGKKLVVVQRTDLDINDKAARELAINDNRIGEINLDWDAEVLASLADEGVEFGDLWSGEELTELLETVPEFEPTEIHEQGALDEFESDVPSKCKSGDIWKLGDHELYCADVTKIKITHDYDALMYDPPWDAGIEIPLKDVPSLVFTDCRDQKTVLQKWGAPEWLFVWNCVTAWPTGNVPLRQGKLCFWYGDIKEYDYNGSHYGEPSEPSTAYSRTRGKFEVTPDPRGKHLSDVYSQPINVLHKDAGSHKHSKPVDWIRMLIANCTKGTVFDPFAGSGTALIACEQLGRKCISYEIEPKYCDIIINRWEELTGNIAVKQDG